MNKWYAVHVRSNQERLTATFLSDRQVDVFVPCYRVLSTRSDRNVTLLKPLFTGYIFVNLSLDSSHRVEVLKAPGSVKFVGFGDGPAQIPDEVINSLKILTQDEDSSMPHPLVKSGQTVKVINGAFKGAIGVLHQTDDKKQRLVVEVDFLGRAVAVPISPEQVQPLR